jgi:hypothetical protein
VFVSYLKGRWQGSTSSAVVTSTISSRTRLLLLLPLFAAAVRSTLLLMAFKILMHSASGLRRLQWCQHIEVQG